MPSGTLLLEAIDLSRRGDDGRQLLAEVDLALEAGERLVLHGPSGAGKTQLLRALALLDPLERGEVLWHGDAIADGDVPTYRSRVIYHQQTPALVEGSVEENLRLPFALAVHAERPFDVDRAADLFARLGRRELLSESTTDDLSGGERQLVSLVRLLLLDPEIVLLDEPTASLDAGAEDRALELLLGWVAESARGLVWVTHDRSLARRVGSRAVELAGGRLVDAGGAGARHE